MRPILKVSIASTLVFGVFLAGLSFIDVSSNSELRNLATKGITTSPMSVPSADVLSAEEALRIFSIADVNMWKKPGKAGFRRKIETIDFVSKNRATTEYFCLENENGIVLRRMEIALWSARRNKVLRQIYIVNADGHWMIRNNVARLRSSTTDDLSGQRSTTYEPAIFE